MLLGARELTAPNSKYQTTAALKAKTAAASLFHRAKMAPTVSVIGYWDLFVTSAKVASDDLKRGISCGAWDLEFFGLND
jgi:hypothetical protein